MLGLVHLIRSLLYTLLRLGVVMAAISASVCAADEAALMQQRAIERIDGYVDHFRKTGDMEMLLPDLQQADAELAGSYDAFMAHGDLGTAALSLIKRGDVKRLRSQGQREDLWQQAIDFYRQAHDMARQAYHLPHQAKALIMWARSEASGLRDYGAAAAHAEEALRLSAGIDDKGYLFDSLSQLASIQDDRGELVAAAVTQNRALEVAEAMQDDTRLFYGYLGRAGVYYSLGRKCDYQKEFQPCYEALQLAMADYGRALDLATKLGYSGLVELIKDFLRVVEEHRKLIGIVESIETDRLRGVEEQRKSTGVGENIKDDHPQKVLFHPRAPRDVFVEERFIGSRPTLPPGSLEQGLNQVLEGYARELYQEQKLHQPPRSSEQMKTLPIWMAAGGDAGNLYIHGTILEMQEQDDAALTAYLRAVELLEADQRTLRDEKSRGTFLEDKIHLYYRPFLHLLERSRLAEAFELLERSRSRSMADLLASKPITLREPKSRELYAALRKVEVNIAALQTNVFNERAKADRQRFAEGIAAQEQEIQGLDGERRRLIERIAGEAPKLQELTVSKPASLQRLQDSLRREDIEVLQYLALDTSLIVWHIRGDAMQVKSVYLPRSVLIQKVERLRNSLTRAEETFDVQAARELFLFLIQPVLSGIRGKHLVVIPHENLHYLPFQVLQDPSDGASLGERFRISYAPSATILFGLPWAGSLAGETLLAVGDPGIGQAREEVTAIAKLYPDRHRVVTEALVQEAELKALVADYSLLHLSVHGEFKPEEPMLSRLKLAGGGEDDGALTAAEMFGLPLDNVRLAVLSACETGRAEATHANEVLGMMRALLFAGAKTLILSSWKVDSAATALWMETFYREAQTKSVSEAARLALVAVKSHPQYGHPYFWGPFFVIGK